MALDLSVNGRRVTIEGDPGQMLLTVLRDQLDLTGMKYGCGEGQCGACTVLVDDVAVRSCITPVEAAAGKRVTTIEGLAPEDALHPVQEAFLKAQAFQCGFCTPGMILGAVGLLNKKPRPNPTEIATALNGHICRCGTYPRIVEAVRMVAEVKRGRP